MPTKPATYDQLLEQARRIGNHKTKKETVSAALSEYIRHRNQLEIIKHFGTIDYDPKYDYKCERRAKR